MKPLENPFYYEPPQIENLHRMPTPHRETLHNGAPSCGSQAFAFQYGHPQNIQALPSGIHSVSVSIHIVDSR